MAKTPNVGLLNMLKHCKRKQRSSSPRHIPQHLIIEILLKLPVEALLRFKSVSKQWHLIISSHRFAILHLKETTTKLASSNQYTYIRAPRSNHFLRYNRFVNLTLLYPTISYPLASCVQTMLKHPKSNISRYNWLSSLLSVCNLVRSYNMGSCNGLLFVLDSYSCGYKLKIWNPATGQQRQITNLPATDRNYGLPIHGLWLFEYIPSLDDYKIVLVDINVLKSMVFVYTLRKDNNWRTLDEECPYNSSPYIRLAGSFRLDEKAHWIVCRLSTKELCVLAFDLVNETIDEVELPDQCAGTESIHNLVTGVVKEKLSFCRLLRPAKVEIWVMETYGKRESWIRLHELDIYLPLITPLTRIIGCFSLSSFMEGRVTSLLVTHGYTYDEKVVLIKLSNKSKFPKLIDLSTIDHPVDYCLPSSSSIHSYTQSLVWPFA